MLLFLVIPEKRDPKVPETPTGSRRDSAVVLCVVLSLTKKSVISVHKTATRYLIDGTKVLFLGDLGHESCCFY